MQKYKVNEKDITKARANLFYPVGNFLSNMQNYINSTLVRNLTIKLDQSLELVVENSIYLTLNDEIIFIPICKLLDINYKEIEENEKLGYYCALFSSKIAELKMIKSEEELFVKFPYIHSLYTKKKEQITGALDIFNLTNRVLPIEEAKATKKRLFLQHKIDELSYNQLLIESYNFNLTYFINNIQYDLTNLVNSLPVLMSNVKSFIVDIHLLPSIDQKKVSSIINDENQLKR